MLARPGTLPTGAGWSYELKWDGFRAIVRRGREFRVRSRRGWNMTPLLRELEALPVDAVLDGELVALGDDGWPYFPDVCDRLSTATPAYASPTSSSTCSSSTDAPRRGCRTSSGAGCSTRSTCTAHTGRRRPYSTTAKRSSPSRRRRDSMVWSRSACGASTGRANAVRG
jgi:hypothetical protein